MRQRVQVYDTFWKYAAERLGMYMRRLRGEQTPWTRDPILAAHRFTNVYRVTDRVSQFLVREVQYAEHRSQAPDEVFFRTILFKLFNRVETWTLLEAALGPMSWQSTDLGRILDVMDRAFSGGSRLYSAAYIMPPPSFGRARKHSNHLALLERMMQDGLPAHLSRQKSLRAVYESLLSYPGLGRFLAFQYAIDLNYSTLLHFDEGEFVIAGPGALDGISKCFEDVGGVDPEAVIMGVTERQEDEFARLGLDFEFLFGRRLQPVDIQNIFCEISKYTRVSHPELAGASGRTRIKQSYEPSRKPLDRPFFPPRWKLQAPDTQPAAVGRQHAFAF
jgi:alpha-glutamyl/putrescinyl thymine pyrophosphorylase clade 1